MQDQPTTAPLPNAPQAPYQSPKSKRPLIVVVVLVAIIAVIVGFMIFHKPAKNTKQAHKETHAKVYEIDITFGKDRAVNACNVLPISLVSAQFGPISALDQTNVTEDVIESNVPESSIDPTDGNDDVTSCLRNFDGGGSVSLSYDGYRSIEGADSGYAKKIASDKKLSANTVTSIAGLQASTVTYTAHKVEVIGSHNGYVYTLDVESGVGDNVIANDVLTPKAITLAKQIVTNMDDPNVSTHPAQINAIGAQIDPCTLFDAATFEQALLAPSTYLQQKGFPKTAYQASVGRQYAIADGGGYADYCSRKSAPKPFKGDESLDEALKDAFTGGSENAEVQVNAFTNAADAQHNVDVLSDSDAEQVSGIGDKATYGQGGLEADIKQLAFSKGNYSIEISANYGDASGTNVVPEADFVSLGKALAAKLP